MTRIELPECSLSTTLGLEQAILERRSRRRFTSEPLPLAQLSHLLRCSVGITDRDRGLRAAPSAGATFPLEVYPVINAVEGMAPGVYRYLVEGHALELVRAGDFRSQMSGAALGEQMMRSASVVLALAAVFQRTELHYGQRAQRYIHFEAGHAAQNVYLVATSLGLGSCAVGAFYDDEFNAVLGLDGRQESVLYIMVVGKLQPRGER